MTALLAIISASSIMVSTHGKVEHRTQAGALNISFSQHTLQYADDACAHYHKCYAVNQPRTQAVRKAHCVTEAWHKDRKHQ